MKKISGVGIGILFLLITGCGGGGGSSSGPATVGPPVKARATVKLMQNASLKGVSTIGLALKWDVASSGTTTIGFVRGDLLNVTKSAGTTAIVIYGSDTDHTAENAITVTMTSIPELQDGISGDLITFEVPVNAKPLVLKVDPTSINGFDFSPSPVAVPGELIPVDENVTVVYYDKDGNIVP